MVFYLYIILYIFFIILYKISLEANWFNDTDIGKSKTIYIEFRSNNKWMNEWRHEQSHALDHSTWIRFLYTHQYHQSCIPFVWLVSNALDGSSQLSSTVCVLNRDSFQLIIKQWKVQLWHTHTNSNRIFRLWWVQFCSTNVDSATIDNIWTRVCYITLKWISSLISKHNCYVVIVIHSFVCLSLVGQMS